MDALYRGIKFKYPFRDFQQRVLDLLDEKLDDGKLHIVAAPGAGKTVLGLEMIRRLGSKTLIFVPSINLRLQWEQRFLDGFVQTEDKEYWKKQISNEFENPGIITCVTYQALYQYLCNDTMVCLAQRLKEHGIKTVCLDEAHHLQNEWWKALEMLMSKMNSVNLISLTATPPYDSSETEWERYCRLCGDIDLEIYAPEMVQKHCICPYQDYIYFCMPDKEECAEITSVIRLKEKRKEEILKRESLYRQIIKHPGIHNPYTCVDTFSKYPEYVDAIISYLQTYFYPLRFMFENSRRDAENVLKEVHPKIRTLLHYDENTVMTDKDFYNLITGIVTYDSGNFDESFISEFKDTLCHYAFMHNGKITRSGAEDRVERILKKSSSRIDGIETIVEYEKSSMKENMRCLVLADRVGKEDLKLIESEDVIKNVGCVSIFEKLRRREHLNNIGNYVSYKRAGEERTGILTETGMLCASFSILPENAVKRAGLTGNPIKNTGYLLVDIDDRNRKRIVEKVTWLFAEGVVKTLIGTSALLGEGWDAPFVNTVVLGSSAATYVQSNQMRGRGLRIDLNNYYKTANIYHLAVLQPEIKENTGIMYDFGDEYAKIARRFDTFPGIDASGREITSGIERLGITGKEFSEKQVTECNKNTLNAAADRETVYRQWMDLMENTRAEDIKYIVKASESKEYRNEKGIAGLWERSVNRYIRTKDRRLTSIYANAMLKTMKDMRMLSDRCSLSIVNEKDKSVQIYLAGASNKENIMFVNGMKELLEGICDQRYIIETKRIAVTDYTVVPSMFCRNKEDAERFYQKYLKCRMFSNKNNSKLVYTRSAEGKKVLFEARMLKHAGQKKDISAVTKIFAAD